MVESFEDAALFLLDPEGRIESWNAGAERIYDYAPSDVLGRYFGVLYTADAQSNGEPAQDLAQASCDGVLEREGWHAGDDQKAFAVRIHIAALQDDHGVPAGFSCVIHDLAQKRLVDQETEERTEERLRMMVEGVENCASFMLDPAGMIQSWNAGAARIKQYEAQEIVGRHFSTFYLPHDVAAGKPDRELEIASLTGSFEEEGWRVRKDGSLFWADVTITALRDRHGVLIGFSKVTRDLTETRAAEAAVRRSDARFAGIVRISEDAIISIDCTRRITLFNEGAEKMFGYKAADAIGNTLAFLIPARFGPVHDSFIDAFALSSDALRSMAGRAGIAGLRSDGTEFPAEASISKFETAGEVVLTVRLRDITERRQAEEALKRSEARFAGIVRLSEDAIISVDETQRITLFNEGAEAIFGYTAMEVIGRELDLLIPARFGPVHGRHVANFSSSADALRPMNDRRDIYGLRKDGSEFPAEASISKFQVAGETILTVRLRDITERKRAEEAIRNSLNEKEILLKEIHHRVKNNLQVVCSLLSLQAGDPRVEAVRDIFTESQNRVTSMALIHEKLYESPDFSNINFANYIESLANHLFHSYAVNPGRITLTTDVSVELGIHRAVPCGLIVNELLSNSLKHAFPNGRCGNVRLEFRAADGVSTLSYSDDGVGMPAGLDFRKTESLGLQLVTALTSQIGGVIRHVPSEGTAFEISFSVSRAAAAVG